MEVAAAPRRSDTGVGCYYVYRFLPGSRSGPPPPAASYFLPGAEGSWAAALACRARGDYPAAIREFNRLLAVMPDLGILRSELGFVQYLAGRFREAARTLEPLYASRVLDSKNFLVYGLARAEAGDFDAADRILSESAGYYPMSHEFIEVDRGEYFRKAAEAAVARGNPAEARRRVMRAWRHLKALPPSAVPDVEASRRLNLALILGLRGDLAFRSGSEAEAAGFYREALGLKPEVPQASIWRRRLEFAGRGGSARP